MWSGFGPTALVAEGRLIEASLLALSLVLVSALFAGRLLYQRSRASLRLAEEGIEFLPVTSLPIGVAAALEIPSRAGLAIQPARVRAISGRCVVLTASKENLLLNVGSPVSATVYSDSAAFRFQSAVRDIRDEAGAAAIYLALPPWLERIQRREYFRIPVQLPTLVYTEETSNDASRMLRGSIDNLSAGGFRVALPCALPPGSHIRVRLPIASLLGCSFEARVVACDYARDFGPMPHRARCEFHYLADEARSLLINYCFEMERQHRRARDDREDLSA